MGMFSYASWYDRLPDENLEVCEENLDLFFKTMFERMNIWKNRFILQLPRPWTEDEILNDYKFTNVYRELDRNSQYEIKNIILDDSLMIIDYIWKIMVFRFFNNPETFELGKTIKGWYRNGIPNWSEYNEEEFKDFIKKIRKMGKNPFTNAYLINSMATPGKSRDFCYTSVVMPRLHKSIPNIVKLLKTATNAEEIIKYLKTIPAVADFIAHEFYQDFTYIAKYTNRDIMRFDQNDYTNVGPGASIGIRLIFPKYKNQKEQKEAIYRLRDMAEAKLSIFGNGNVPYVYWNKNEASYFISNKCNITLHQIEMWLCEFQKYWKMIIGSGKQRSVFIPKTRKSIL